MIHLYACEVFQISLDTSIHSEYHYFFKFFLVKNINGQSYVYNHQIPAGESMKLSWTTYSTIRRSYSHESHTNPPNPNPNPHRERYWIKWPKPNHSHKLSSQQLPQMEYGQEYSKSMLISFFLPRKSIGNLLNKDIYLLKQIAIFI